jgi:anti-sigma B factor antagonist
MEIMEDKHEDLDVVILSGRFVMACAQDTRERLKILINDGTGKLIIDMESVSFIDSSACAVLVAAFKDMQLKRGRLILVTSPVVQSLIELTRLHTIFEILPTLAVAIDAFNAQ